MIISFIYNAIVQMNVLLLHNNIIVQWTTRVICDESKALDSVFTIITWSYQLLVSHDYERPMNIIPSKSIPISSVCSP